MAVITKYANKFTQVTGNNFKPFKDLNNLKNNSNAVAKTNGRLSGKTGSNPRPSSITATDFRFNLPVGAEITNIKVEYAHQKLDYVQGKYPAIGAPTITLMNNTIPADYNNKIGVAPTSSMKENQCSWNGKHTSAVSNVVVNYKLPSRDKVNHANFGVRINYPANTNTNEGYMQLKYIRITITYTEPKFELIMERVDNEELIAGNTTDVRVSLTNINQVKYEESAVITLPSCVSLDNFSGNSGLTIEGNVLTFKPMQPFPVAEVVLRLRLEHESSCELTATTLLDPSPKKLTFNIQPMSTGVIDETEFGDERTIHTRVNDEFKLPLKIPVAILENLDYISISSSETLKIKHNNVWVNAAANTFYEVNTNLFNEDGVYELTCKSEIEGIIGVSINIGDIISNVPSFILKILPEDFEYPSIAIFELTDEEKNRLGNGFVYTVQSLIKLNCDLNNTSLFKDYYRNFRLGVFNEEIPEDVTVDSKYIFDHCNTWSKAPTLFNHWENQEIEFVFDENNPVYIILTGDFITNHPTDFSIDYTEPGVIQSDLYSRYEQPGNFPEPILNLLDADVPAEISINSFKNSNSIVLYSFPFDDDFGTNNYYAVRGIEFSLDIAADNRVVALLTLKHPSGDVGEKSIVIEPGKTNKLTLGGIYDTWGFRISQLSKINDLEFELEFKNLFSSETGVSNIILNNAQVTAHFMEIPSNVVYCIINGEDGRHYGIFLEGETKIPFGVETDTDYYKLKGIDLNDAYRMSIDKKEITLEFCVFGCTFEESTQQMKEIAKLLINNRDSLSNPIPNIIEFSHLPGEHFEYIIEDAIDTNTEGTDLKLKAKIIIPDGTSWANEDTVSNYIGVNDGIAKVAPIIQLIPLSTTVDIIETKSNQKFSITNNEFNSNQIVEINCNNQKVLLKSNENDDNPQDITGLADFDVDWFRLDVGQYVFDSQNTAIIQTVTITKRG